MQLMVSIWSPLLLTLHTKALIQNVLRGEKLSVCVPPGQSVADGGWDVIIIELKQYLQAITSCSFDPGPRILSILFTLPVRSPRATPEPGNTRLNLNENQGGAFDDLFKLTMNVPMNILILMESHLEN